MGKGERTALVVGASRGLGLGLAAELRRRGWGVVGTVRDEPGAARLAALGGVAVERVDVADARSIEALRRRLEGQVLDLLFVNAGIQGPRPQDVARARDDQIARLFLVNAIGPIRFARRCLDLVRDGPGVVAFMSSGMGSIANNSGGLELYRASKAALNSLSRSFAAALGGRRVTVLAVAPGWVRTDMGGPHASLSVEESVRGVLDAIEARRGTQRHGFVNWRGREVPW
jgi:NAD(P)-dependent dehydrogenase (short-subunit alcohol dehydrogenase family)